MHMMVLRRSSVVATIVAWGVTGTARAEKFTALGARCQVRLGVVPVIETFSDFRAVARADGRADLATEAAAQAAYCGATQCPVGDVAVIPNFKGERGAFRTGAVVFRDGAGVAVLSGFGFNADGACASNELTATALGHGLWRLGLVQRAGDYYAERGCEDTSEASSLFVPDLASRRFLVVASAVGDGDDVAVAGQDVRIDACGDHVVRSLQSLRAGATETLAHDATWFVERGRTLTRAKDYAGAVAAFDAALGADPTRATAFSGRGYARMLAGDAKRAQVDFEAALGLDADPKFQAAVYFNLGLVAEAAKDAVAARRAFERSQALNPSAAARRKLDARH